MFTAKEAGENKVSKVFGAYRPSKIILASEKKKSQFSLKSFFLKYKSFIPLFGTF